MSPWSWFAFGGALLIVEAFAPGFVFLWLGVAAALVGVVVLFAPELGWQAQAAVFALATLASVGSWVFWRRRHPATTDLPDLNRRARGHIGRVYKVVEPIRDGHGRVRVGDGTWSVRGPDLPVGARVRVIAVEDTILMVEPADDDPA